MLKKFAVIVVAFASLSACSSSTPEEEAARAAENAQYYSENTVNFEKILPNGASVTCFVMDGYAQSLQCFPTPTPVH